jgi:hypothetical protein
MELRRGPDALRAFRLCHGKSGLLGRAAGDRVRRRLGVGRLLARRARAAAPFAGIENRHSPFLSQGLCSAAYSRTLNNPRAIEDRPAEL